MLRILAGALGWSMLVGVSGAVVLGVNWMYASLVDVPSLASLDTWPRAFLMPIVFTFMVMAGIESLDERPWGGSALIKFCLMTLGMTLPILMAQFGGPFLYEMRLFPIVITATLILRECVLLFAPQSWSKTRNICSPVDSARA